MFYIIDTTTGEVMYDNLIPAVDVGLALRILADKSYNLDNMIVQTDCKSGFNITAWEWLGIV